MDRGVARMARTPDLPWWGAALVGMGCAVVMIALRKALEGLYGDITGFMILLPAVMVAGLAGGVVAGLTAVVVCLAGGWAVVGLDTPGSVWSQQLGRIATTNFLLVGAFASILSASLRSTVRRLDASVSALDRTSDAARMAEAARLETQAELRAMIDQASAGIARVDSTGLVVSANARFAEILGLTPRTSVGIRTSDVTHPDDIAPTLAMLQKVTATGSAGQVEKRYLRPDGTLVWALTSLAPLKLEGGQSDGYIAVLVDITDAKTAEGALRESEARFRVLADTAPSPVWMTNEAGEVEFVNAALAAFYGGPAEEVLGHVWKASIHPDDVDHVAEVQAAARPNHLPYSFECRFRRNDAEWRWMRVSVSPRFVDGRFEGYVGLSFDVTDTRAALDALAIQERRQTFLLGLADRMREMTDASQVMAAATEALTQKLGVLRVAFGEVDETQGLFRIQAEWTRGVSIRGREWPVRQFAPVYRDMTAGTVVAVNDVAADARTGGSVGAHEEVGEQAFITAPLMRGGHLRAFMVVSHDTVRAWTTSDIRLVAAVAERVWSEVERTRAEAEVIESEARFRAIADTAPVLIWVTGPDRRRSFVNQAYVAYYGQTYDAALTLPWQDILHPDDQARIAQEALAGEATGQPFSMEARYRRGDGEFRWLKSFSRPRLSAQGEILGFVGVAFDISDARRAEQDLKRINELLEERVGEALAEKAKAEADLMHAQRMEAVGRLTGGVAHDFNNLLTVVIGALDLMLKTPEDTARLKKLGGAALAAARRGEGLTHQLLAFTRRQALRPEVLDLNPLIERGEPLFRRAVGEAVTFDVRLRRGGAKVKADPAQFEAALLNLLVNARDAVAGRADARISVTTRTCRLKAGDALDLAPGAYVCVTVKDNGQGMDAETQRQVFEPFFTTKPVGKGTGLGLSQVYGFVRQSGGGVVVSSRLGRGTEVQLFLPPLSEAEAPAEPAAAASSEVRLAGRDILLVEDDPEVAATARSLLEDMGVRVSSAASGPEALKRLKRKRFDLVMTDIVMPGGMTGIELARQVALERPETPILLTSGYAGEDVETALADAPWRLLPKPYSGAQLRTALSRELAQDG